ncbi:hypothetical protein RhiirA5_410597 [Rhizophagus irregularis]|uniref:Uncharacterized protein n=1 Tax=Rhizophagus irregularis TaxID=588596 RepID=A0A2N0Q2W2_9GLOM|nr:hypothetical protein RhiirA5_410597 [Rhizophagus irregularis]
MLTVPTMEDDVYPTSCIFCVFLKEKNKKGRCNKNDQESTYYYFDSISLNATEAPIIAISFHFPVPFYDIHKDWISECNIGPAKILTAAETNLIRSNPKEFTSLHLG